jgi:hypothetical protein
MAPSKNIKVGPQAPATQATVKQSVPPKEVPIPGVAGASQPSVTSNLFPDKGIKKIA